MNKRYEIIRNDINGDIVIRFKERVGSTFYVGDIYDLEDMLDLVVDLGSQNDKLIDRIDDLENDNIDLLKDRDDLLSQLAELEELKELIELKETSNT
jgi:hypothetical protein